MKSHRALGVVALAIVLSAGEARAFEPPPIDDHVTDPSRRLAAQQETSLEGTLATFRRSTGHEIAVFVPTSLEGETIEDVAHRTFNAWKLGRQGEDDGVLLVIAPVERRVRIETGRGIGDRLPDVVASRIIRGHIAPHMKAGDLDGALQDGVAAIMATLRSQPLPPPLPIGPAALQPSGPASAASSPGHVPAKPLVTGPQTRRQALLDADNERERRRDLAALRAFETKKREDAQTPFVIAGFFAALFAAIGSGIWLQKRRHAASGARSADWDRALAEHAREHRSTREASSTAFSSSWSSGGGAGVGSGSARSSSSSSSSGGGFRGGGGSSGGGGASGSY